MPGVTPAIAAAELVVPQCAGGPPAEKLHQKHSPAGTGGLVNCAASVECAQFYSRTLQSKILSIQFSALIYSVLW